MNRDGGLRGSRGLWALRIIVLLAIVGAAGLVFANREQGSISSSLGGAMQAPIPRLQGLGYSLDALTGLPVSGATVTVDGTSSTSGADGSYQLKSLSTGEKIAVVTHGGSVPNAFHFSVYAHGTTSTSVHTPPAYLVPKQPAIVVPAGGGTVSHGQYQLSFQGNTQSLSVRLTGFGEHPGTPAPPVAIPAAGSPQPPRPPVIPAASNAVQAFPQSVFHVELPGREREPPSFPSPSVAPIRSERRCRCCASTPRRPAGSAWETSRPTARGTRPAASGSRASTWW